MDYSANVQVIGGKAEVSVGKTTFTINAGAGRGRAATCPVELLMAAFGS